MRNILGYMNQSEWV
jgi:hypothetical protein